MQGILDERGNIPHANSAFIADAVGSMSAGLLGSSALVTYVESAAAVREGGRTGVTSCVCAFLFFFSCFFCERAGVPGDDGRAGRGVFVQGGAAPRPAGSRLDAPTPPPSPSPARQTLGPVTSPPSPPAPSSS